MGILDFLSREAGQRRRRALEEAAARAGRYIPPNLRPLSGFLADMTPTASLERAGQSSQRMLSPNRTPSQRVGDLGAMLSDTAAVAAPALVAGRAAMPAAQALQEGLLGVSVPARAAGGAGGHILDETASPALPKPRNKAEVMAKRILEMRAAGNAGDVTDDMMALADDQYMYYNTPIPMDEAVRTGAGRGQDFDIDYFHGTGSDIVGVDPSKLGQKQNVLGEGFYTSKATERADRYVPKVTDDDGDRIYAEGGNVMPLATRGAGEFDLTSRTGNENISRIAKAFEGSDFDVDLRGGGDSAFIKSKTDPSVSVYIDSYEEGQSTLSRLKSVFGNANLTAIFKEAGFTGLKGAEGAGSTVRVSYKPENVRSRFARFDPEFRHLRNLSAGVGGVGLLGASQYQQSQRERGLLQ